MADEEKRLIIDESWKEQAQREKEMLAAKERQEQEKKAAEEPQPQEGPEGPLPQGNFPATLWVVAARRSLH